MEIILSGNCYWCTEAVFQQIKGCLKVEPGYYKITSPELKLSENDKVEVVKIEFNSELVSLKSILDVFFIPHNPTLVSWEKNQCVFPLNRSAIIICEKQHQFVRQYINSIKSFYENPIHTQILIAETNKFINLSVDKHNFYKNNPQDGYCTSIINPKLNTLKIKLKELLNE